ncbi:MAG: hypothetical protein JOS17DRAFT_779278 [Linnemannia elongata]|nr:MAG: hypothetical protein JOS17DRAFT_779278 [Linnemannia elongata]
MASSRHIGVGSAFQTSFKTNEFKDTHVYKASDDIIVVQLYEDGRTGYAGIKGVVLDEYNTKQTIHAVLPDNFIQASQILYYTHQRLINLFLEDRSEGTIIQCTGTMTMTMLASGSTIKNPFAMEVKDARLMPGSAPVTRTIPTGIFPTFLSTSQGSPAAHATAQQDPFDIPLPSGLLRLTSSSSQSSSS